MNDIYNAVCRLMLVNPKIDGVLHTQKQICEDCHILQTTVNINVQELVKRGYVMLVPGEETQEKSICYAFRSYLEQNMNSHLQRP